MLKVWFCAKMGVFFRKNMQKMRFAHTFTTMKKGIDFCLQKLYNILNAAKAEKRCVTKQSFSYSNSLLFRLSNPKQKERTKKYGNR